jgi:hypothetical protein
MRMVGRSLELVRSIVLRTQMVEHQERVEMR